MDGTRHDSFAGRTTAARLQERWSAVQGFSGLTYDPQHHTIQVFWNGPVPDPLLAEVVDARQRGIEITMIEACFSAARLQAEAHRLTRAFPFIRVISPRPGGDGLDVGVTLGAIADATARGVDLQALLGERVPVYLTGESDPKPL